MTETESRICEGGCRCVPGVSDSKDDWAAHKRRYQFAKRVVRADLPPLSRLSFLGAPPVSIVDLGCGVGYGSRILATIPHSEVWGVDVSPDAIRYAAEHYRRANCHYRQCEIHDFVARMEECDYVAAIEVIEHLQDGFEVLSGLRFRRRLVVSTPYAELLGANEHHVLFGIVEQSYSRFSLVEFFYTDRRGYLYEAERKPERPLNLICVISREDATRLRGIRIEGLNRRTWLVRKLRRLLRCVALRPV